MSGDAANPNSISPAQALMPLLLGVPVLHAISAAANLGIFGFLASGARGADEVARRVGTLEEPTYRLMRGLSALGLLDEQPQRRFSLTAMGSCLVPGIPGSFDALARMNGAAWGSAPFAELEHSLRTGQSAFSKYHGESMFSWLAKHPAQEELFGHAMSTFSGMEVELVLAAYDFSNIGCVVDIGGGHGMLLARILERSPRTRGVLYDMPKVVERAKSGLLAADLTGRCEAIGGDFFERVPDGGDLYVLKHILHDWDDERAVVILRNVAAAMKPGARLLVIEQGIAPPGVSSPGKVMDLIMLSLLEGGRERGAEDQRRLFERAGLAFEREISTPGPISLFVGNR